MATVKRYEEMESWQIGRELVKRVYQVCTRGDFARDFGLRDQICRAAVSVCSNIAEGFERQGNKELANFLWIAKGSAGEVSSQLYHALDVGYISHEEFDCLYEMTVSIRGKLYSFIKSMSSSLYSGQRYRGPTSNVKP